MKYYKKTFFVWIFVFILFSACNKQQFSGQNAYNFVREQLAFGPRIPGSQNASNFRAYLVDHLSEQGWIVETQSFEYNNEKLGNIIARNSENPPQIILGTHYDTRRYSDRDAVPQNQIKPVPGANDGASGTAILLELASLLDEHRLDIWLVFFDAEDQGRIDGWEWSVGAQKFVGSLIIFPESVIIIDMVADFDLEIYKESNSSLPLMDAIWESAALLGYADVFIDENKYTIIDDHLPFINQGMDAVLIIDIDYPHWHTTSDDISNISADSMEIVGSVIFNYINSIPSN